MLASGSMKYRTPRARQVGIPDRRSHVARREVRLAGRVRGGFTPCRRAADVRQRHRTASGCRSGSTGTVSYASCNRALHVPAATCPTCRCRGGVSTILPVKEPGIASTTGSPAAPDPTSPACLAGTVARRVVYQPLERRACHPVDSAARPAVEARLGQPVQHAHLTHRVVPDQPDLGADHRPFPRVRSTRDGLSAMERAFLEGDHVVTECNQADDRARRGVQRAVARPSRYRASSPV